MGIFDILKEKVKKVAESVASFFKPSSESPSPLENLPIIGRFFKREESGTYEPLTEDEYKKVPEYDEDNITVRYKEYPTIPGEFGYSGSGQAQIVGPIKDPSLFVGATDVPLEFDLIKEKKKLKKSPDRYKYRYYVYAIVEYVKDDGELRTTEVILGFYHKPTYQDIVLQAYTLMQVITPNSPGTFNEGHIDRIIITGWREVENATIEDELLEGIEGRL